MTATLARPLSPGVAPGPTDAAAAQHPERTVRWDLVALGAVLLLCALVHGIGFDGWPGRINDDEGTYVAQAWAMTERGQIAHYTFAYDHPFLGWAQMSFWMWITGAMHWTQTAVSAGRIVMLGYHLATCAVLYGVARRLDMRPQFALLAVAAFSLSPLAVFYQRMAFLDNIAVFWALAALFYAASPKRSAAAAVGAGACIAIAIWSKETVAILLPIVFWVLRQHSDVRNRSITIPTFWAVVIAILALYPLFAITKGEFLPGPEHTSLIESTSWQLFGRPSSGSPLDAHSASNYLIREWLGTDAILVVLGSVLSSIALCFKKLRPVAVAVLIQLAMLARGGYLPFAYVTAVLPFAALVLAGVADRGWRRAAEFRPVLRRGVAAAGAVAVLATAVSWTPGLAHAMTADDGRGSYEATQWFLENAPRDAVVLTDDNIWTDLVRAGQKPDPIWFFKLDLDPAVKKEVGGWQGVDYIVMAPVSEELHSTVPTVMEAFANSKVIATFEDGYTVRQVIKR